MRATAKYFWTVIALFAAQIRAGGRSPRTTRWRGTTSTASPLSDILPYAVTRTWHTQLAVFWIATAWLATGLYLAPALGGGEPRFQKLGVNLLYVALLVVVVGSMAGEWLGVQQLLDLDTNFWLGHQGWEYVDLGRVWQLALFAGLMLWLGLVGRALWPALRQKGESQPLTVILFLSTVAIGLFYGAGLTWGKHTHLSMIEYWRWWVVHLWVEGFFEVFATAAIALLTVKLGLVRARTANHAVLFATVIFLTGGVLGTLHHLYFSGTTTGVIAVGAGLLGAGGRAAGAGRARGLRELEADQGGALGARLQVARCCSSSRSPSGTWWGPACSASSSTRRSRCSTCRGLNLTATHAHAALFGVYGLLGIGLMLFCLRGLFPRWAWSDRPLAWTFWLLNGGLAMMVLMSLFPVGVVQAWASVQPGPVVRPLRGAAAVRRWSTPWVWLRVPGDIVFSAGAVTLAVFAAGLALRTRRRRRRAAGAAEEAAPAE